MAKHLIIVLTFFVIIFSCKGIENETEDTQRFQVTKYNVGYITDSTQIKDLKFIFPKDSIFNRKEDDSFVGGLNPYEIFEKNGNHLLSIFPTEALDSTALIDYIILKDNRYKTVKGISNESYFSEVKNNYKITEINNELNNLSVNIDSINTTLIFNKNELNRNFEFGKKFTISQIPDSVKISVFIKYF